MTSKLIQRSPKVTNLIVEPFSDQFRDLAGLLEVDEAALRQNPDRFNDDKHWLAYVDQQPVGLASAVLRPDDRLFVRYRSSNRQAYGPLTRAIAESLRRPLYTSVDLTDRVKHQSLTAEGFTVELVSERFEIRFDHVLGKLERSWLPPGYALRSADTVDEERLFLLDNHIRGQVPGTDGWQGNRSWFHGELTADPSFDPAGYQVAIDNNSGDYVGLIRIWRNTDGPSLGLLGVIQSHRHTTIAAALLAKAVTAASLWGHETMTAWTSTSNTLVHRRLTGVGASQGKFAQLVLRT